MTLSYYMPSSIHVDKHSIDIACFAQAKPTPAFALVESDKIPL